MICNADSRRQWLTSPCLMHLFMVYSCIFWLIHGEPPKSRLYTFVPQWAQRSLTSQNRSLSWNQVASGRSETGDEGTAVFHQLWRDHSDVLANVYRNAIRLDASDPCHSKSLRPIITSCGAILFCIWHHLATELGPQVLFRSNFCQKLGPPQVQLDTPKSTHPTRICLAATEDEVLQQIAHRSTMWWVGSVGLIRHGSRV